MGRKGVEEEERIKKYEGVIEEGLGVDEEKGE